MNNIYKLLFIAFIFNSISCNAAEMYSVEWVAEGIAKNHNANATSMIDNMVVATSASSIGKNVVLSYVLNVQKNLSSSKLNEFQNELIKEIAPKTCQVNKQSEAFTKGLYYTFVYHNRYGEKLAEFVINKKICERLR